MNLENRQWCMPWTINWQ